MESGTRLPQEGTAARVEIPKNPDASVGLLARVDRPPPCGLHASTPERPRSTSPRYRQKPDPHTVSGMLSQPKTAGNRKGTRMAPDDSSKANSSRLGRSAKFAADATKSTHDRMPWARRWRWWQSAILAKSGLDENPFTMQLLAAVLSASG